MKNTHKSNFELDHISADTAAIETDCNTIVFQNIGQDNIKINVTGQLTYSIIPAGTSAIYGGRDSGIVLADKFDIEFLTNVSPLCNVEKETLSLIE